MHKLSLREAHIGPEGYIERRKAHNLVDISFGFDRTSPRYALRAREIAFLQYRFSLHASINRTTEQL